MKFLESLAFPPEQEAGQEVRAYFVNCGSILIFNRQKSNDRDCVGNPEQQEQY
jgi:hypothetical protein